MQIIEILDGERGPTEWPKGRDAGAKFLREFAEDVKASGLVAKTIEKNDVRGLTVAAKA